MKTIAIRVQGKVQGVFFRASTVSAAQQFGIKGFVRNEPDGSVYIEAEGNDQSLQSFVSWCRIGPPRARVDKVSVEEKSGLVFYKSFDITR